MNKTLPILTALFTASAFAQAAPQTLDVYTYDSFSADWSAGPKVKAAFFQQFPQCKLNYVAYALPDNDSRFLPAFHKPLHLTQKHWHSRFPYEYGACTFLHDWISYNLSITDHIFQSTHLLPPKPQYSDKTLHPPLYKYHPLSRKLIILCSSRLPPFLYLALLRLLPRLSCLLYSCFSYHSFRSCSIKSVFCFGV